MNAGGQRRQPLSQAQSDARMSQAMRNLSGIQMQLANTASFSQRQVRAQTHVQQAIRELSIGLTIR